jgi:hypothetical protein
LYKIIAFEIRVLRKIIVLNKYEVRNFRILELNNEELLELS